MEGSPRALETRGGFFATQFKAPPQEAGENHARDVNVAVAEKHHEH
jgi:hypothetical protein